MIIGKKIEFKLYKISLYISPHKYNAGNTLV